jgi:hypothetical protein
MGRVVRHEGVVAACVWDHGGGHGPLSLFWSAAHIIDPAIEDESQLAGAHEGHLGELFKEAGLGAVEEGVLPVQVEHPSFDEWWEPFTLGVGPAGGFVASLDPDGRAKLRDQCRKMLPAAPFALDAQAWAARGIV